MNVLDMAVEYLKQNGFDGLFRDECGCLLDDIAPCGWVEGILQCEAGYKVPCPRLDGSEPDFWCDCLSDNPAHAWHVVKAAGATSTVERLFKP